MSKFRIILLQLPKALIKAFALVPSHCSYLVKNFCQKSANLFSYLFQSKIFLSGDFFHFIFLFCQFLSLSLFVAGNATYKSLCRSVRPSVRRSVGPSHFTFFAFLSYLKVEKFRYEYFMDITAPAQIITAPAQLITAPAQPPATGVVVYTALFLFKLISC